MKKTILTLLLMLGLICSASAQDSEIPGAVKGPKTIKLGNGLANLELPEGFQFVDKDTTIAMLKAAGNSGDGSELGCILMNKENEDFFVIINYDPQGYVKDDDAAEIDADALLKSYQEGTEAANEERKKAGVPALHVTKWGEKPHYDKAKHHLIWGLEAESEGRGVVNFNTRVLGREGVMSMNLVCSPEKLPEYKPVMDKILAATQYAEGKKYADYQEGDKVSEAGLLALLAGGAAAAKLGLFAKLGKLLLGILIAGKKFIVIAIVGIGALAKRFFGGGATEEIASSTSTEMNSEETPSPPAG